MKGKLVVLSGSGGLVTIVADETVILLYNPNPRHTSIFRSKRAAHENARLYAS